MKRFIGSAIAATVLFLAVSIPAGAQNKPSAGTVIVPTSSVEHPGDLGVRAHTTYLIYVADGSKPASNGPEGETPASLGCVYFIVSPISPGCTIPNSKVNPSGGWGAIALVDAFDDPNAASDLAVFSQQFGLSAANFTKVYATGTAPPVDSGWALEESLDIEWAHAMAPNAKIYLVEAASNGFNDLFYAESVASTMISAAGGGDISNSWIGGEFSGENTNDSYFSMPGIVYFASSGDSGGEVGYPSVSPNVVSAGGTRVNRLPSAIGLAFAYESGWSQGGGGSSLFESRPTFQNIIQSIVGTQRGVPDFSFDADPASGVSVYDSTPYQGNSGWWVVGGTSVSSPSLAGIVNSAASKLDSNGELNLLYSEIPGTHSEVKDIRDIIKGNNTHPCMTGWDFCSGVGSPFGLSGK